MTSPHSHAPDIFVSPVAARLTGSERILRAGAGGGFDVFTGIPLFLALRRAGKQVYPRADCLSDKALAPMAHRQGAGRPGKH